METVSRHTTAILGKSHNFSRNFFISRRHISSGKYIHDRKCIFLYNKTQLITVQLNLLRKFSLKNKNKNLFCNSVSIYA